MRHATRLLVALLAGLAVPVVLANPAGPGLVAAAEAAFLDYLDANGAVAFIEGGRNQHGHFPLLLPPRGKGHVF